MPTPEQSADLVLSLSDPQRDSMRAIAEEMNLPESTVNALMRKLDREGLMLSRSLGEVRKSDLKGRYLDVADRILRNVTDEDIRAAKLKDKILSAAIATDKAQLLDGLPTEILSIKEMQNIDTLCALLVKESERRGYEVYPNEGNDTVALRQTNLGRYGEPEVLKDHHRTGGPSRSVDCNPAPSDEPR